MKGVWREGQGQEETSLCWLYRTYCRCSSCCPQAFRNVQDWRVGLNHMLLGCTLSDFFNSTSSVVFGPLAMIGSFFRFISYAESR